MSAGLTAALLPLCLASPALADTAPPPAAPPASAAYVLPGWDGPNAPAPISLVAKAASRTTAAPATAAQPVSASAAAPADAASTDAAPGYAASADAAAAVGPATAAPAAIVAPVVPEPAAEPVKQSTVLRMSGPGGTVAPGKHTVAVRLLADDAPVKDGYVRLEKLTSSGWTYAGRLLTRGDGLGIGQLTFAGTTRMRAVYQGALTRTPAQSSELVVTVRKAMVRRSSGGGFRVQALSVARQQAGKPYVYGATGPNAFDCSGLVRYAFSRAGKSLPRTSYAQLRTTQPVSRSAAQPGDLIFVGSGHVGIYAGGGMLVDAPKAGSRVSLRRIWSNSYVVRRVV